MYALGSMRGVDQVIRRPARSIAEDVWRDAQRAAGLSTKSVVIAYGPPSPERSTHDPVAVIAAAIEAIRAEPCSCRCPDCSPHPHGTTAERPNGKNLVYRTVK